MTIKQYASLWVDGQYVGVIDSIDCSRESVVEPISIRDIGATQISDQIIRGPSPETIVTIRTKAGQ